MPEIIDYNRPKATTVNDTPINFKILLAEQPNAVADVATPGTTANLDSYLECNIGSWKSLFHITTEQQLMQSGLILIVVTVTPILGDGSNGTPIVNTFVHDQNMDNFQTAAGFPRV
jgi:hypothetical protein